MNIAMTVIGGKYFVGTLSKDVTKLEKSFEMLMIVSQEMQLVPIKIGTLTLNSKNNILLLDKESPFYVTYKQITSNLTVPTGPTIVK